MFVQTVLVVALLGSESVQGTSALEEARQTERVRLVARLGATTALAQVVTFIGPAVHLELGTVIRDRFCISAMIDLASQIGVSSLLAGANFTWAFRDWLGLSAGFGIAHLGSTGWEEFPSAQALLVPLHADFTLPSRGPHSVARSNFTLSLMVAPGVSRLSHAPFGRGTVGAIGPALVLGAGLGFTLW